MVNEYTISLTVKKEINGKTYGLPYTYKTTFTEYGGYVNPNTKPFLENDKEFDRKELEILFDLLLRKFYGKGDENAQK